MIGKLSVLVCILVVAFIFVNVVYEIPVFGDSQTRSVASYYLSHGLYRTGSANIVNAIVWDFRGFDTIGEETVLFSAAIGVFLVMRRKWTQ